MRIEKRNNQFSINKLKELKITIENRLKENKLEHNNYLQLEFLHNETIKLLNSWNNIIRELIDTNSKENNKRNINAISEIDNWVTIRQSYELINYAYLELLKKIAIVTVVVLL